MKLCLKLHGLGRPPAETDPAERPYWIDVDRFEWILDLVGRSPTPVRLSFDDGNVSDVEIALPRLREAGLTASFFFSTDFIGKPGYADEDDIRTLAAAGMEIGSHGCQHASWREMSGDAIAEDVIRSFARLETITHVPVVAVAPPYDECDARVLGVLRRSGVKRVYGGLPGPTRAADWLVRRYAVTAQTDWTAFESRLARRATTLHWVLGTLRAARAVGLAALATASVRGDKSMKLLGNREANSRKMPSM